MRYNMPATKPMTVPFELAEKMTEEEVTDLAIHWGAQAVNHTEQGLEFINENGEVFMIWRR
jgi:hypothetical protein